YHLGEALLAAGEYDQAPPLMRKVREVTQDSNETSSQELATVSHYYSGRAYVALEKYARAKEEFQVVATKGPADSVFTQKTQRPWNLSLTTGIEYNDNVVLFSRDVDVDPTVGISNQADFANTIYFTG